MGCRAEVRTAPDGTARAFVRGGNVPEKGGSVSSPSTIGILLVEDDLHSREGMRHSLRAEGYQVEMAADLWETIRLIKEVSFDVAIIDLDFLPLSGHEVSGWELTRIVRAHQPGIAIILIGAEDGPEVRRQAAVEGVAHFLEKPISLARIKAMVRQLRPCGNGTCESAVMR
jgi:two-component system, OmpR family, response regulator